MHSKSNPSADLLDAQWRERLERDALPGFVARQRWFGGKARAIQSVRFADWARLAISGHAVFLTIVTVAYEDGSTEQCHVPLAVITDDEVASIAPDARLAPTPDSSGSFICDAMWSDTAIHALMDAVAAGATFRSQRGEIVASASRVAHLDETAAPIERLPAVHSNSALTVGGRYLLKLFRRIEPGVNPDVEIGRFLERAKAHVNTPALIGSIEYHTAENGVATLALVQTLVPSRINAWDDALEHVGAYLDAARGSQSPPTIAAARELVGAYPEAIALLGRRTAELHLALAAAADDPDFVPEPATALQLSDMAARERAQAVSVLDLLQSRRHTLQADVQPLSDEILSRRSDLVDRIDMLWAEVEPFTKIRIHGDYHLGQVLCVGDDFVIIDFEGEPARPLAERRAKQSPMRDVAGMLRSFSYAAEAGLRAAPSADRARADLASWAHAWEAVISAVFVEGYLHAAGPAIFVPRGPHQFRRTLDLFVLHKAIYELQYEMNNRPSWVALPLRGIRQILEAGENRSAP
jgi:trehalose synthase-fused probable maltokinase